MSKAVKKVFKTVKKVRKKIRKFVKKHWKKIAIAGALVFTVGAFAVTSSGASWGAAFSNIGSTMSAGMSSLTGGLVGTSANAAVGAGTFGVEATVAAEAAAEAAALGIGKTAGGAVSGGGISMGTASLVNTGLQAVSAYQDGKAAEKASKSQTYYGMDGNGNTANGGLAAPTPSIQSVIPGQHVAAPASSSTPSAVAPQSQSVNEMAFNNDAGLAAPYSPTPQNMDDLVEQQYGVPGRYTV